MFPKRDQRWADWTFFHLAAKSGSSFFLSGYEVSFKPCTFSNMRKFTGFYPRLEAHILHIFSGPYEILSKHESHTKIYLHLFPFSCLLLNHFNLYRCCVRPWWLSTKRKQEQHLLMKWRETTVMLEGLAAVEHPEVLGDLQISTVKAVQGQSTRLGVRALF